MNMMNTYIYALIALVMVLAVSLGVAGYMAFELWQRRAAARRDLHSDLIRRTRSG